MKPKIWLATFGVISLLLIGGAGFFCLKAKSGYDEAMGSWGDKLTQIESLSKRVPFPSPENTKKLEGNLKTYKADVDALYQNLNQFQTPLNEAIRDTEFQQLVRTKVDALKAVAKESDFLIVGEEDFYLGFDTYKGKIPAPDVVPTLDFELGAIDHLVRAIVESNATSLLSLTRDLIPGEEGASSNKHADGLVHKYPVRLRFTGSHQSFQTFLNRIANDKKFFYIVRVMKVTNSSPDPPAKLIAVAGSDVPRYKNPDTEEVAMIAQLEEAGWPTASESEVTANMKLQGYEPADEDAKVLMGQESLEVYMIVDVVRFLDPSSKEAKEVKDDSGRK